MSRAALYTAPRQFAKDWGFKVRIEQLLREHPGYGYRRVALALGVNKKRAQRVMKLFGIKAYRRRGRRFKRARFTLSKVYPNLLLGSCPSAPGQVWVSDFTRLVWQKKVLYLATVLDLFTREVVGWSLQDHHAVPLVLGALFSALLHRPRPGIFHITARRPRLKVMGPIATCQLRRAGTVPGGVIGRTVELRRNGGEIRALTGAIVLRVCGPW